MIPKTIQNAVVTVVLACAFVIFVVKLTLNPQLLDLVLPVALVVAAVAWLLTNWDQHQKQQKGRGR